MKPMGRTHWAIASGHIPLNSNAAEPEYTSRDCLCVLNTGDTEANIEVTILYADRDPIGPYKLRVAPRRVRRVRFNDLIDPLPIPLDCDYGAVAIADVPVVIEFFRLDTGLPQRMQVGLAPYSTDAHGS
jgi:hypothetical protein